MIFPFEKFSEYIYPIKISRLFVFKTIIVNLLCHMKCIFITHFIITMSYAKISSVKKCPVLCYINEKLN